MRLFVKEINTCVDWIRDYYQEMMNDVFDFYVRMIVVDEFYVSFSLLTNDDVYPNDWDWYLVMMFPMKQIPIRIVDDENRMYHENSFDVDYYAYDNENLLTMT